MYIVILPHHIVKGDARRSRLLPTQNIKRVDATNSPDTIPRFHSPTRDDPFRANTPKDDAQRPNNTNQKALFPNFPNPPPDNPGPTPLPRLDPRKRLV